MEVFSLLNWNPAIRQTQKEVIIEEEAVLEKSCFRFFELPQELRDLIYGYSLGDEAAFKVKGILVQPANTTTITNAQGSTLTSAIPSSAPSGFSMHDIFPLATSAAEDLAETREREGPKLRASVKFKPRTDLLLCSKALKREYEECAEKAMTLVLKDHEQYSFEFIVLPEQVKQVQWLELKLIMFCHHCFAMSHTDESSCHAAVEIKKHCGWITNLISTQLPKLRSISIHAHLCHHDYKPGNQKKVACEPIIKKKVLDLLNLHPKVKELKLFITAQPEFDGPMDLIQRWPEEDVDDVEEKKSADEDKDATAEKEEDAEDDVEEMVGVEYHSIGSQT